jgi:6-hydroxynicotinate reductase
MTQTDTLPVEIAETETKSVEKIRCDACPVMCFIAPGQTGACDRYASADGRIVRTDPVVMLSRSLAEGERIVPFAVRDWDGSPLPADSFVTGIGSGTTYPDYKPAPFIVSSSIDGADMVTVVTEAIFSYCGVKVKIDTDRHLGREGAVVRARGEAVGHVTTAEYGSQMLSLGGVHRLTGGSRDAGPMQWRGGGTDHRWRIDHRGAGRKTTDCRWPIGTPDARWLRVGHHWHVR